jgi:hypothetical protein
MNGKTKAREINGKLDEIAPYPSAAAGATAPVMARYLAKQALVTSELATARSGDPRVSDIRAMVAEFAAAHAPTALAAADPNAANLAAMEIYGAWEDGEGVHWWPWQHLGDDAEKVALLARELAGLPPRKPRVVCLCGSTRFYDAFQEANYDLTMQGAIVLSVGFYPHSKAEHGHGEGVGHDSAEKVALDELHKRKIDLADEVLVVSDESGYFGESTYGEIRYARSLGKPVRFAVAASEARWVAIEEGVTA